MEHVEGHHAQVCFGFAATGRKPDEVYLEALFGIFIRHAFERHQQEGKLKGAPFLVGIRPYVIRRSTWFAGSAFDGVHALAAYFEVAGLDVLAGCLLPHHGVVGQLERPPDLLVLFQ